jgi:hypothetical protein
MRVVAAAAGMPSVGLSRGQPFFAHVLPRVAAQALKGQKDETRTCAATSRSSNLSEARGKTGTNNGAAWADRRARPQPA